MLLRLIISQVCHPVFIWASEILTSISLSDSCFFFILPSACLFILSTLFHFHCLTLFLSLSLCLPLLYCWGWSFTGCVQCQIQWKTARDKGVKKHYAALKSEKKQRCGFVSGRFYSRKLVSAVLQRCQWCSGKQKGCMDYNPQLAALTRQITTRKVQYKQKLKWMP